MVQVVRAGKPDEITLNNLMQLYLHDFSEFDRSQISSEARFEYPYLTTYFAEPDRHTYLIWAEESLAGFAVIKKGSEIAEDDKAMDVAEFFVLRSRRMRGVGRAALERIVSKFPGPWIIRVQDENQAALEFWHRVIPAVSAAGFTMHVANDGQRNWTVFRFEYVASKSKRDLGQLGSDDQLADDLVVRCVYAHSRCRS